MVYVYILYSNKLKKYYVGSCFDLNQRIVEHRNKVFKNSFTTKAEDWELFMSIDNLDYKQARKIEMHIKKMRSKKYYEDMKKYPEMCRNLIDRFE